MLRAHQPRRHRVLGLGGEDERLVAQLSRVAPAALELRQRRAPHGDIPAVVGEPDGVRELLVGVDLGLQRAPVAELHQVHDAPVAALQHALAVVCGLGRLDHLGRGVQAFLDPLRCPAGDAAGVEGGGERGGVAGRARVLDGLRAQRLGAGAVGVVELDRQPRPQPRGQRPLVPGQAVERLFERRVTEASGAATSTPTPPCPSAARASSTGSRVSRAIPTTSRTPPAPWPAPPARSRAAPSASRISARE